MCLSNLTAAKKISYPVKINVYDAPDKNAGILQKRALVGSFVCDFDTVYYNGCENDSPGEIYRQWLPLSNQENSKFSGIMGRMRLSIRFVGPGDTPRPHNLVEELKQEEAEALTGSSSSIMPSLEIKQTLNFLVLTIYRAEGLPVMDRKSAFSNRLLCDPYVTILFGNNAVQRLSTAKASNSTLSETYNELFKSKKYKAAWREQIWLPIEYPTMGNTIRIQVFDEDSLLGNGTGSRAFSDELIATAPLMSFKQFEKYTNQQAPFWVNLYGAPHPPPDGKAEEAKHMNMVSSAGSHYNGRLLLSLHRDENKHSIPLPQDIIFRKVKKLKREHSSESGATKMGGEGSSIFHGRTNRRLPPECNYVLRFGLFAGAGLNHNKPKDKFSVEITCGDKIRWISPEKNSVNGSANWLDGNGKAENTDHRELGTFPEDASQVPDVIIYLLTNDNKRVAYTRFNAKDIMKNAENFKTPRWYELVPDPCFATSSAFSLQNILKKKKYDQPGELLLRIAMYKDDKSILSGVSHDVNTSNEEVSDAESDGTDEGMGEVLNHRLPFAWKNYKSKVVSSKSSYQVQVSLYQARDLPAADANGLIDPYWVLLLNGERKKT